MPSKKEAVDEDASVRGSSAKKTNTPFAAFLEACANSGYQWDDGQQVFTYSDEIPTIDEPGGSDGYSNLSHAVTVINQKDASLEAMSKHVSELENLLEQQRDAVADQADQALVKHATAAPSAKPAAAPVKKVDPEEKPVRAKGTRESKVSSERDPKKKTREKEKVDGAGDNATEAKQAPMQKKSRRRSKKDVPSAIDTSAPAKSEDASSAAVSADSAGESKVDKATKKSRTPKKSKAQKGGATAKVAPATSVDKPVPGPPPKKVPPPPSRKPHGNKVAPEGAVKEKEKEKEKKKKHKSNKVAPAPPPKDKKKTVDDGRKLEYKGVPVEGDGSKTAAVEAKGDAEAKGDLRNRAESSGLGLESSAPFLNTTAV